MNQTQPIIREARPNDAAKVIEYVTGVFDEPEIDLPVEPGEFDQTVEQEQEWIRELIMQDNSLIIVAEVGGGIVGLLDCKGGLRKANRHVARLGITVHKEWRDRGVGRGMMEYAVEWARGSGIIKRLELEVFTRNSRAIHLYESVGFQTEGTLRRCFIKDGQYIDCLIMAVLFD